MTLDRTTVAEPFEINFAHIRREPFRYMISGELPAQGAHTQRASTGEVHNYFPWGVEEALPAGDTGAYGIRYAFRGGADTEWIFAYCVSQQLEVIYGFMVGRDFGDQVTPAVARRWPKTFDLLLKSCGAPGWPAMIRLTTAESRQWAVGLPYVAASAMEEVLLPPSAQDALLRAAADVEREVAGFEALASELIPILGGDDYVNRTLKRAAKVLNTAGDINDFVQALR